MIYRYLYTILFSLALPLVMLRLLYRSIKAPAYRQRWPERFGFVEALPAATPCIWVHAVSVGETLAAAPLIRRLLLDYPQHTIVITTTTPTGSERVQALFAEQLSSGRIRHAYATYDIPGLLNHFLDRCHPSIVVIMETELWPNLVHCCAIRKIPVVLANARLSEKSARGYGRFASLTRTMLGEMTCVAVQNITDGERFLRLGLPEAKRVVTGSIKFDLDLDEGTKQQAQQYRQSWSNGNKRLVWLVASTHPGEDEMVVDVFQSLRKSCPELLLVLVPRHPERFNPVAQLCRSKQLNTLRRSEMMSGDATVTENTAVLIGDTMGELMWMYGVCDVTFVGGSLVPVGGHNLIEPAAWAKPIVTGPHLHNFSEISQLLSTAQALQICESVSALESALLILLADETKRHDMGQRAYRVAEANRGALNKLLAVIGRHI